MSVCALNAPLADVPHLDKLVVSGDHEAVAKGVHGDEVPFLVADGKHLLHSALESMHHVCDYICA